MMERGYGQDVTQMPRNIAVFFHAGDVSPPGYQRGGNGIWHNWMPYGPKRRGCKVTIDMCWCTIKSQADIDHLLEEYYDFHDSCIVSVNYVSGAGIDQEGSMSGINNDCKLVIKFESQMPAFHKHVEKKTLEMKFIGLRRLNLIGYQNNYFCDISGCYLSFYNELIVWSEDESFNPGKYRDDRLFEEPMETFIVASHLEWRFA